MTPAAVALIEEKIKAARKRGDSREVGRLRAELPFEERQRIFGQTAIAAGRGVPLPVTQVTSSRTLASTSTPYSSIRMSELVLRQLRNIGFDGREEAGFLIGSTDSENPEILDYVVAHDQDSATWASVQLNPERGLSILVDLPSDRTIVGEFHSHPTGNGVRASEPDMSAAAHLAKVFHRSEWISLIVCEPEHRLAINGEVGAYVVRPDGNHRVVEIIETRSH
jgi:proteasome lid subunit RPN8/RPN11